MANTIANVIAGKATVSYDLTPDLTTPGNNTYVDFGYTEAPVKFEYKGETNEALPEQETFGIKEFLHREELIITVPMMESSLANLQAAMVGATIPGAVIVGPNAGSVVQELALRIVGPAPSGLTRTIIIPRCVSIGGASVEIAKGKAQMIEAKFKALKPSASVDVCTVTDA